MAKNAQIETHVRRVGDVLRDYAGRGVFRSISEGDRRGRQDDVHDGLAPRPRLPLRARLLPAARSRFRRLLPGVPAAIVDGQGAEGVPRRFQTDRGAAASSRRFDARRRLRIVVRGDSVSVALVVKNSEFEYATRRLVHLAQEVFMVFLPDGPYSDYRIEKLGLDPDNVWV